MGLVSLPPGLHALKIIISYIFQVPCKQWYLTTHRVLIQLLVLCISNVQGVGGVVSSLSAICWLSGHDSNETVQDEVVPHLILQWHQQPWLGCLHKLASPAVVARQSKGWYCHCRKVAMCHKPGNEKQALAKPGYIYDVMEYCLYNTSIVISHL